MPRVASPLSSNDHRYFTRSYIFIRHILWVLLGASCMIWVFTCFALCFKSWILAGHTYLREPKLCHDLLELLSMLHLNLFELWNCSSASLISFWAWCALVFLKKFSLASLKLIWEKEILCSCCHLYLFGVACHLLLCFTYILWVNCWINWMSWSWNHIMPSGSFTLGLESEIFWGLTITILVIQAIHE